MELLDQWRKEEFPFNFKLDEIKLELNRILNLHGSTYAIQFIDIVIDKYRIAYHSEKIDTNNDNRFNHLQDISIRSIFNIRQGGQMVNDEFVNILLGLKKGIKNKIKSQPPLDFRDYLTEKGKKHIVKIKADPLYKIVEKPRSGTQRFVYLLHALNQLGLSKQNLFNERPKDLFEALTNYFGRIGTPQGFKPAIEKVNDYLEFDYGKKELKKHVSRIKGIIK